MEAVLDFVSDTGKTCGKMIMDQEPDNWLYNLKVHGPGFDEQAFKDLARIGKRMKKFDKKVEALAKIVPIHFNTVD